MSKKPIKYTVKLDYDIKTCFYNHNDNDIMLKESYFSSKKDLNLFSIFDTNNDHIIDMGELKKFINCVKGGDDNNNEFVFDEEHFEAFKKAANINENVKIDKKNVESMLLKISDCASGHVVNYHKKVFDPTLPKNFEENLANLKSDISFDTTDKKFKEIFKLFDVGSSDTESKAVKNDDKLSPDEIKNLWKQIKENCTTANDKVITYDKEKIENFIKTNLPDKNISADDVTSFIETINLAMQNRKDLNTDINWKRNNISQPNARIDSKFEQNNMYGDCWFLAPILSLSISQQGRDILNDSLRKDDKGNIYVHLRGPNETYVITPEEFTKSNNQFAKGDGDVRAIEIAINKYFEERNISNGINQNDVSAGIYLLTGLNPKDVTLYKTVDDDVLNSIDLTKQIVITCTDDHALSVVKKDEKFVYVLNQGIDINWKDNNPKEPSGSIAYEALHWENGSDNTNINEWVPYMTHSSFKKYSKLLYIIPFDKIPSDDRSEYSTSPETDK